MFTVEESFFGKCWGKESDIAFTGLKVGAETLTEIGQGHCTLIAVLGWRSEDGKWTDQDGGTVTCNKKKL